MKKHERILSWILPFACVLAIDYVDYLETKEKYRQWAQVFEREATKWLTTEKVK